MQEHVRSLSFEIPEGVTQSELIEHGYAIDGVWARRSVAEYVHGDFCDRSGEYVPFSAALFEAEEELVEWLGDSFEVQFS